MATYSKEFSKIPLVQGGEFSLQQLQGTASVLQEMHCRLNADKNVSPAILSAMIVTRRVVEENMKHMASLEEQAKLAWSPWIARDDVRTGIDPACDEATVRAALERYRTRCNAEGRKVTFNDPDVMTKIGTDLKKEEIGGCVVATNMSWICYFQIQGDTLHIVLQAVQD